LSASRSSPRRAVSLRRRAGSCFSSVVSPSLRRPGRPTPGD
jgi:hypothetical protein